MGEEIFMDVVGDACKLIMVIERESQQSLCKKLICRKDRKRNTLSCYRKHIVILAGNSKNGPDKRRWKS